MIYLDRYSLQKRPGTSKPRKPKHETPKERFEKVQNLFYAIKDVYQDNWGSYCKINMVKYSPKIIDLCELGAFKDIVQILPPILEFSGQSMSLDPLDVFNEGYGPICGPKNISVTHVVLPENRSNTDVDILIKKLQRMFSSCRFGEIQKSSDIKILKYNPNADKQELEQKIRGLDKSKDEVGIAIAVIPDDNDELYFSLKRLLPRNTQVPLQIITKSTFEEILSGRFRGSQYLCLKILIKSLKKGEAIWKLSNAAGLSKERTLFIGIGFSRYPREGKVSKCAAVLHDAYGNRVTWEVFSTLQERTITKQWFDALLSRIRYIIEDENPTRLVFYRTGTMHDTELIAVENSLKEFSGLSKIKVSFISILEVGNFRFYLYDRRFNNYQNLPAGYAILINDKEAFLSSSNYDDRELKIGTVIPLRLKLEIGDDDIIDVLKEYHDLTYLNWPAPRTTAKHPLVITIAGRFSELTRENVSTESMFYLDL